MTDKNFTTFLSQLQTTNASLDFFTNFDKCKNNIENIKEQINELNKLLNQPDLKKAINDLLEKNKKAFDILNILIAVREPNKEVLNNKGQLTTIKDYFTSAENIYDFFVETGLEKIFKENIITDLTPYILGVEVGLDTNARKNRCGTQMENLIANILDKHKIPYTSQVSKTLFPELNSLGVDIKVFDFAIKTKTKTFLIETNFYNSNGSKLNEVARSYTDLNQQLSNIENFEFVWITDGKGWLHSKNKLEEAYNNIPYLYNLITFEDFLENVIKKDL